MFKMRLSNGCINLCYILHLFSPLTKGKSNKNTSGGGVHICTDRIHYNPILNHMCFLQYKSIEKLFAITVVGSSSTTVTTKLKFPAIL